jgi:TonB-linked SusC/RagA family outer membrane protein
MKKLLLVSLCFLMLSITQAFAQNRTVTGTVTAKEDGQPIPGVTVKIKGSHTGVSTNGSGKFTISVPVGATLEFTAVGYYAQGVVAKEGTLDVSLAAVSSQLGEVVVTGYQTQKVRNNTSALTTISGAELNDKPNPSIDELLAGKSSGVQVTTQNGDPNGNAYIRLRGIGSINASDEPLLVVDGVQIPDNATGQFYNGMNPNDIASVTVLKDAASASQYGARGANGVIVITTKQGSKNSTHINYYFQYGVNKAIPDNFKLMDATQKLQYEYDLGYTNGQLASYLNDQGLPTDITALTPAQRQSAWANQEALGHNWENDILRTGHIQQHQITVNGGDEKTQYYVSLEKYQQDGISPSSGLNRWGGKVNLNTIINPWFSISNNANVSETGSQVVRDRFNAQSPFTAMYSYNPYEPVFNKDGSYNVTEQGINILEELKNIPQYDKHLTAINNTTLSFHPIKGLNISSAMGLVYNQFTDSYYIQPGSELDGYVDDPSTPGLKQDDGRQDFNYDWVNKAEYSFTVKKDHHFNVLGVEEFQKDVVTSYNLESKGFPDANLSTQDNGSANTGKNSTTYSAYTLFSLLGKLDYDYKEKYFLSGSFRRDGSSRFGANVEFGTFYAVSGGWLITAEDFAKNIDWLNVLKIRASYGTSGNFSGIGNYQALGTFTFGKYNGLSTAYPNNIASPNLTWEKKLKRDIGVDFQIFKGITGTVDLYDDRTTDLLFALPVSQTTGFSTYTKNVGAMINKGIEFSFNADVINKKGFRWSLYGNITHNVNKVTALYSGTNQILHNGIDEVKPGYPIYTYYMVRYAGVNSQTGAAQFYDKNGKITETYSSSDAVLLPGKSPNPKLYGGYGTSVSYKGLELSGDFTYQYGGYTYNNDYQVLTSWGGNVSSQQSTLALNYWKKPGDVNVLPKPIANGPDEGYTTDFYLQKDNYVRFKNLTLSYTLPKSITQKVKVYSCRVFVQGENLATFNPDHFFGDPEVGIGSKDNSLFTPGEQNLFSYNNTRQFSLGVNVTF